MKKSLLRLIDRVALADAMGDLQVLRLNATGDARYVGEEARKRLGVLLHDHRIYLRNKWEKTREKQKGRLKAFWEQQVVAHEESIAAAEGILNGSEPAKA